MRIIRINPQVTAFYYGADAELPGSNYSGANSEEDWVYGACFSLGVACYAICNGNSAIVFDTLCSPEQAAEIKSHLESEFGIAKFTVVASHWHLHHIGGNELYKAFNIVGTRKTRDCLIRQKREIESGTSSWGPPPIETVRAPDIVFDQDLSIFLDDLEVRLYAFNIHSDDCLCAYIPAYKILLAGDMVEDSIPFISDPDSVAEHVKNYDLLRGLDIERILPNHCCLASLAKGGYSTRLIESSAFYLNALQKTLSQNSNAAIPDINTLMRAFLAEGVITYWPPYERVHKNNIEKLKKFYQSNTSPSS